MDKNSLFILHYPPLSLSVYAYILHSHILVIRFEPLPNLSLNCTVMIEQTLIQSKQNNTLGNIADECVGRNFVYKYIE